MYPPRIKKIYRLCRLLHHFCPPKFTKEFHKLHKYIQNPSHLPTEEYHKLGIEVIRGLLSIPALRSERKFPKKQKQRKLQIIRQCISLLFKCTLAIRIEDAFNRGFLMIFGRWKREISFSEKFDILKETIKLSDYNKWTMGIYGILATKEMNALAKTKARSETEIFIEMFKLRVICLLSVHPLFFFCCALFPTWTLSLFKRRLLPIVPRTPLFLHKHTKKQELERWMKIRVKETSSNYFSRKQSTVSIGNHFINS